LGGSVTDSVFPVVAGGPLGNGLAGRPEGLASARPAWRAPDSGAREIVVSRFFDFREVLKMFEIGSTTKGVLLATLLFLVGGACTSAVAASAAEIDAAVDAAMVRLHRDAPATVELARKAEAVLVFPSVVKGGLMVGGQYGQGALRRGGQTTGYYRTSAVSYGFQAGAQSFGYALFFMSEGALRYLDESRGWELGTGPSLVVLDEGMAKTFSTTTIQHDVYGFVFGQQGLMAGVGLQGSKISRIYPED
jgi:lipid-binding SYLF domain-containing protein